MSCLNKKKLDLAEFTSYDITNPGTLIDDLAETLQSTGVYRNAAHHTDISIDTLKNSIRAGNDAIVLVTPRTGGTHYILVENIFGNSTTGQWVRFIDPANGQRGYVTLEEFLNRWVSGYAITTGG